MRNILSQTCVGSKEHFSSEYFGAEKKIRWSSGYAETSVETPEMYGLTQLGQHSKDKDERGERVWCTQHTRQRDNNIQTVNVFFLSFLIYIYGLDVYFTLITTTFRGPIHGWFLSFISFNIWKKSSRNVVRIVTSSDISAQFGGTHDIHLSICCTQVLCSSLLKMVKFGEILWSLIWQNSYFTPLTKQFVRSQTWRGPWWNFKPNGTFIS